MHVDRLELFRYRVGTLYQRGLTPAQGSTRSVTPITGTSGESGSSGKRPKTVQRAGAPSTRTPPEDLSDAQSA